jgi:hypothetical protein
MNDRLPTSVRPVRFPSEYGTPGTPDELLPWSHVEEQLRDALNYWVATIGPGGVPHVRPVDGVWVDGTLCFGGSPETRWAQNLAKNQRISVNLPSDTEAIILQGTAKLIENLKSPLAMQQTQASNRKYPQYGEHAEPIGPFWTLRPTTVLAWHLEGFPKDATRFDFAL